MVRRADFHVQNFDSARKEAERLLGAKTELKSAWLGWVASRIYSLQPAAYASMVRRELQRLQEKSETTHHVRPAPKQQEPLLQSVD